MSDPFSFADELGPAKVVHVHEPGSGLRGILVVDNVAAGPSIGGLRIAEDVSAEECFRLARAMTLKNAAASLPHGGGKTVVFGDPKMSREEKERLVRTMAVALRGIDDYIFGPDMGTDERSMAWVRDEIGRSVGLPREVGGIPLDEIGATGWGILHATRVALEERGLAIDGLRVVVQGFGAVGRHAARFLVGEGAVLVGAADSRGAVYDPAGIDVEALADLKHSGASVTDWPSGEKLDRTKAIEMDCDVLIPAARPDVIHADNAGAVKATLVVEGANIPVTVEAERLLHTRGVLCVPDFIANAGGVICAAMEYRGATESGAMAAIAEKVEGNTREVLEVARERDCLARDAAVDLAQKRVHRAMDFRRHGILSSAPGSI